MSTFFALLRLQLLTRYADLKPKNLKAALRDNPVTGHYILIKGSNGIRLFELVETL